LTLIRNRKLWLSAVALAMVHLLVVGASFFAPCDPTEQNREFPLAPPMRIHFADSQGRFHFRAFVCPWSPQTAQGGLTSYAEDCQNPTPLRFLVRGDTRRDGVPRKADWHLFGVDSPRRIFLLGTDDYGRDQFSRLLHGGQISLGAGLSAAGLSLVVGLLFGCAAGFLGSWIDGIIMRATELFMALPWIYLLFAVRAFLPLHLSLRQTFLFLIAVIGLAGWARPARLIRGVVLSAKERGYVLAARGFGASSSTIVRRHILPEVSGVALTQAALLIPQFILAEVTLSFLGLGVGEPVPSWGAILAGLQSYYILEDHWWMLASALILVPIFLLYYSLADSLQKRLQIGDLAS
jgi:peptide/nickel transport system permease protein